MARRVTHLVFDMDGLLLDTERFYTVAQQKILNKFGMKFDLAVKEKMMGRTTADSARVFIEETGLAGRYSAEEFIKERAEILQSLFPQTALLPGVRKLLDHIVARRIPACIATSSNKRHFELKTEQHMGLFGAAFSHFVTGGDVEKGKPDPEIFQLAVSQFADPPAPEAVLVFEDAVLGVQAAVAGGFNCVHIPAEGMSDDTAANVTLRSMEAFDPAEWGLPPY